MYVCVYLCMVSTGNRIFRSILELMSTWLERGRHPVRSEYRMVSERCMVVSPPFNQSQVCVGGGWVVYNPIYFIDRVFQAKHQANQLKNYETYSNKRKETSFCK